MDLFKKINNATLDYAHEIVPVNQRRGPLALFAVWFVIMVNLTFIFFGINISRSMPLEQALLACVMGQTLGGLMLGVTAYFSAKINLPSTKLLPHVYGRWAAPVFIVLLGGMGIFWFGFQLELFSKSLTRLLGMDQPIIYIITTLGGLVMISSGIIGFKAVDWLSRVATPLLLLMLFLPIIDFFLAGNDLSNIQTASSAGIEPAQKLNFGLAVSVLLGGLSVPLIITADIMRYAKEPKQSFWITFLAQTLGAVIIIILAVLLGKISQEMDFIDIISGLGMGGLGLVLVMLATWTTNDANIYISSLAFSGIFKKIRKWKLAIFCGIAGIGVGMFGVVDHFITALGLLGILFGPAGAVFQVSILKQMNKVDFTTDSGAKALDVVALGCFLLGCCVAMMTNDPANLGFGYFELTTIPMMDGYLISGISYFLLSKFIK